MRLYNYLNEEELDQEQVSTAVEEIKKNCQPFLKDLEGNHVIYSGRNRKSFMFKGQVRKNRRPKDTPEQVHDLLNELFKKHTGKPLRSTSLFVKPGLAGLETYGRPYAIFPIGKYEIGVNSKVTDLYYSLTKTMEKITKEELKQKMGIKTFLEKQIIVAKGNNEFLDEESKKVWNRGKEEMEEIIKGYKKDFPSSMDDKEGMLVCDYYIGVNKFAVGDILEELGIDAKI